MFTTPDILIIEDHDDTRRAMVCLLKAQGYQTQAVGGGVEALDLLQSATPRIIILDRMMPGMDGRQFLRAIRQQIRLRTIPVIDYSAALEPYSAQDVTRLGIQARVTKSAGWDELHQRVHELIGPPK
ncbi:MAG TPA: response regulator [Tepidisphaeraceae bacterium]|nr:response regulator [Tepidisphaeraceae bacterium]